MRFMITESQILKKESKRAKRFIIPFLINAFSKEWEQTWSLFPLGCRRTFVLSDFFLPLQFLLLTNTLYATGHLAGDSKLGPAIPPVSPPSFLCTLSLLAGGMGWEVEKESLASSYVVNTELLVAQRILLQADAREGLCWIPSWKCEQITPAWRSTGWNALWRYSLF